MNLDIIEKHVHLTPLANGSIEVMFGGQPCLSVNESYDGGYSWRINPLFAKLTYGANIFEDVPYCYSSLDTVEEAIASGLSTLNDLKAFHGIVDLPADTYAEEHLDESVEDLDEAVTHKELLAGAQKAYIEATRQGNGVMARHYGAQILKHRADIAKQMAAAKQKRMTGISEDLDEAKTDWETDHGNYRPMSKKAMAEYKKEKSKISSSEKKGREENAKHIVNKTIKPDFPKGNPFAKRMSESEELSEAAKYRRDDLEGVAHKTWYDDDDNTEHKEALNGPAGDELNRRPGSYTSNKNRKRLTKDGKITSSERSYQSGVKAIMKVTPIHGPKGRLPESVEDLDESAEWAQFVKESIINDCRKEALKYSDSIMEAQYLAQGLLESVMDELDEAALSGDAYWKAKEEAAKEAKAKEERASMGIKEPVKKGRGKPTNIDLEFVHAAAKKNVEAGKRPTAGMERNEKIHFVRHLSNHPDFAEKHVAAAGRPTGTTKAAKVEKEVEKKKEASAFSMWAGLGKK